MKRRAVFTNATIKFSFTLYAERIQNPTLSERLGLPSILICHENNALEEFENAGFERSFSKTMLTSW